MIFQRFDFRICKYLFFCLFGFLYGYILRIVLLYNIILHGVRKQLRQQGFNFLLSRCGTIKAVNDSLHFCCPDVLYFLVVQLLYMRIGGCIVVLHLL